MDREETLLNYLQGRLDPDGHAAFEAEMAADTALRAEVELMQAVRQDLGQAPEHEKADAVWERLSQNLTPAPANTNSRPFAQIVRYAAVAVLAVAAWQFAVVPRIGDNDQGFRTATTPTAAFALQVKFLENTTIGEIGAVLAPLSGTITNGPSALGLVIVAFPDQASRDAAMTALSGRDDLTELVVEN